MMCILVTVITFKKVAQLSWRHIYSCVLHSRHHSSTPMEELVVSGNAESIACQVGDPSL